MRLDSRKLDLVLARNCFSLRSLRGVAASAQTLTKVRKGEDITPVTAGRIAKALEVDVTEILAEERPSNENG